MYIGGEQVRGGIYQYPYPPSVRFEVYFDSTHFADATQIAVRIVANSNFGAHLDQSQSAPAYNKAFVFGNDAHFFGDLAFGIEAVTYISARFANANHQILPSTQLSDQLDQVKPPPGPGDAFFPAMPASTAFYGWTHGLPGQFKDSTTGIGMLYDYNVADAVSKKVVGVQPPYNFAYLDACYAGQTEAMATAFGVVSGTDRAFVGWPVDMQISLHDVNWSNRLMQAMDNGFNVTDAIGEANRPELGGQALDGNGMPVDPTRYGDEQFKLHGVYLGGSPSLTWYR